MESKETIYINHISKTNSENYILTIGFKTANY